MLVGEGPSVPDVIGYAPHLRVTPHFRRVRELGGAGRQAEHDRPSGLRDCRSNLADLAFLVRVIGDAIDLEEVESPRGVELQHRIVIRLAGSAVAHSIIAVIPGTIVEWVGGIGGGEGGTG